MDPNTQTQPSIVVNMPGSASAPTPAPAPAPAAPAEPEPTIRYLTEQLKTGIEAGTAAAPELTAKVESVVQGYGVAKFTIAGSYFLLAIFAAWMTKRLFAYPAPESHYDMPWPQLLGVFCGVASVALAAYGLHCVEQGAVAYFAPLVWALQKLAEAS